MEFLLIDSAFIFILSYGLTSYYRTKIEKERSKMKELKESMQKEINRINVENVTLKKY